MIMNHRLLELVKELNFQQSPVKWYNFRIDGTGDQSSLVVGKILPENAKILSSDYSQYFSHKGDDIVFTHNTENNFDEKSSKLAEITKSLAKSYLSFKISWLAKRTICLSTR